jgi:hypothetical protein
VLLSLPLQFFRQLVVLLLQKHPLLAEPLGSSLGI